MKKISVFLLSCFLSVQMMAQKSIENGHIKMEIVEATSDNEEMAMGLEMLKGTETNYYFDDERTLVTQSMMGGMVEVATMTTIKDKTIEMFFNMMGNKTYVETSEKELNQGQDTLNNPTKNMKVVYNRKNRKKIAGFDCFEATITNPDLEENAVSFTMYVSDEIKANSKMIQTLSEFNIEGFPLEFSIEMEQMKMVYSTTAVADSFDQSVFKIDRTGYTKMTMEQFQQQMGGMGQGLGF